MLKTNKISKILMLTILIVKTRNQNGHFTESYNEFKIFDKNIFDKKNDNLNFDKKLKNNEFLGNGNFSANLPEKKNKDFKNFGSNNFFSDFADKNYFFKNPFFSKFKKKNDMNFTENIDKKFKFKNEDNTKNFGFEKKSKNLLYENNPIFSFKSKTMIFPHFSKKELKIEKIQDISSIENKLKNQNTLNFPNFDNQANFPKKTIPIMPLNLKKTENSLNFLKSQNFEKHLIPEKPKKYLLPSDFISLSFFQTQKLLKSGNSLELIHASFFEKIEKIYRFVFKIPNFQKKEYSENSKNYEYSKNEENSEKRGNYANSENFEKNPEIEILEKSTYIGILCNNKKKVLKNITTNDLEDIQLLFDIKNLNENKKNFDFFFEKNNFFENSPFEIKPNFDLKDFGEFSFNPKNLDLDGIFVKNKVFRNGNKTKAFGNFDKFLDLDMRYDAYERDLLDKVYAFSIN